MPTQATSNQMFERTLDFLLKRYPENRLNLHLVHGAALISELAEKLSLASIQEDNPAENSRVVSESWFHPRKKTFLAPFGVGTVDQSFLSVLRSKHFFLRLFGLSHKIIIFDEVHAYDIYMTQIFIHLLTWLRAVGTSVIILTATLPRSTREELIQSFGGAFPENQRSPFPRLTIVNNSCTDIIHTGEVQDRRVSLGWTNYDGNMLLRELEPRLRDGGCAAVICNRVRRAQEIYQTLRESFSGDEMFLFHSQFPYCWREDLERNIINSFGKGSNNRPKRSIVVATQVIEQSLDLDFDLMVSDLAPIDLLIQRIGRLHRHGNSSAKPPRPPILREPICLICSPGMESSEPDFGNDIHVYEPAILLRTLFALHGRDSIHLPSETDDLIEAVYDQKNMDFIPQEHHDLVDAKARKMKLDGDERAYKARSQLIPSHNRYFFGKVSQLFKDEHDPSSHAIINAQTRDARPSVQLICLRKHDGQFHTLDGGVALDLNQKPTRQQIKACLRSSINVSETHLVQHFIHQHVPEPWHKIAALRSRLPLILDQDHWENDTHEIQLDRTMGLLVRKKG